MIKIAIVGYGNLGRGVEQALSFQKDMTCIGIFTRREPSTIKAKNPVYHIDDITNHEIDVAILCGGSATDLMHQGPEILSNFNVVDSFDTHAKIPEHYKNMEEVALHHDKLAMISTGWDPGLFSIMRLLSTAILPQGKYTTFWGRGVSQGHSDAVRRIEGVKNAVQYTIPREEAVKSVLSGDDKDLGTRDKHLRQCYVVKEEWAEEESIREQIVNMPHYFADYDTIVEFIDEETFLKEHNTMPHGGRVIHRANTSPNTSQTMQFILDLDSNPEFTASVNVACARAVYRAYNEGQRGVVTMFEVPLAYLSSKSMMQLREELL